MSWSHSLTKLLYPGTTHRVVPRVEYAVFGFTFLVRLIALLRLTSSPFLLPSDGDMHFYDTWARQILNGHFTDGVAFYGLPLYAYFLASVYAIFGDSPFVPGLLQAAIDAGTATLLYKIAVQVFHNGDLSSNRGNAIGILAAAAWTFFVPAAAYSVILMPTSWFIFVFWFVIWEIVKSQYAPSIRQCFGYGALIGITATGLATILVIVPIVLLAIILRVRPNSATGGVGVVQIISVLLLFIGIGMGTAPCWVHNYFVARDPVFLSAHSGVNFWLGNNPDATGYPHFPGLRAGQAAMLKDSIDVAEAAVGKSLRRSEVSNYWSTKAKGYIANNFGAWLNLMGHKVVRFWNAFEYDDINVIDKLRNAGVILPGPRFGLVAALAFPGLCLSVKKFAATRWIAGAIGLLLCAILTVFVTERYRLAVLPGLLLFASAGLWTFWQNCSLGRNQMVTAYLAMVAAMTTFVTWPQRDPAIWALKFYNSGLQALDREDWTQARQDLEHAHFYAPGSTEVNLALGNLWLKQEKLDLAKLYYSAVLQTNSRHRAALSNLGLVLLSGNSWEDAATYLRIALDIDPNDGKIHYLYARAQFGAGHVSEAISEIQTALRLNPGQPEFERFYELVRPQP